MIGRKRAIVLAAAAAGFLAAASTAGAQAAGTQGGAAPTPQSGFNVENLLMELSNFLPEEYAGFGGRGFFVGGPGGQGAPDQGAPDQGQQGQGQQGQGQQQRNAQQGATGGGQRPQGFEIPQFKRDAKLMLTAKQVDALLPALQDLQKTPYPTPSQAKKVTATVDATLTKQQKDAYDKYVKERDKALAELRKQFASRAQGQGSGTQGGGFVMRGEGDNAGTADGQRQQGQRQQVDPAELRKRMLAGFIENLTKYRATLK